MENVARAINIAFAIFSFEKNFAVLFFVSVIISLYRNITRARNNRLSFRAHNEIIKALCRRRQRSVFFEYDYERTLQRIGVVHNIFGCTRNSVKTYRFDRTLQTAIRYVADTVCRALYRFNNISRFGKSGNFRCVTVFDFQKLVERRSGSA